MSNELFVELNDEQQEIVSGGISLGSFETNTDYSLDTLNVGQYSASGPNGSVAYGYASAIDLDTSGSTEIKNFVV
jgi:hypothetical protein